MRRTHTMTQAYRLSAFLAWLAMATMALAGFAAFSPTGHDAGYPTGSGQTAGRVAAVAFQGSRIPLAPPMILPAAASQWESTVRTHFEEQDVERALAVVFCESSGNPEARNVTSNASGLFQHLPRFWSERSDQAGFAGADIQDPDANIGVAAWLVYHSGGWRHWYPSAACWSTGSLALR